MLQRRRDKSHCGERELVWISSAFLLHHVSPSPALYLMDWERFDAVSDMTQFCHRLEKAVEGSAISFTLLGIPTESEGDCMTVFSCPPTHLHCQDYALMPLCAQIPLRFNSQDLSQDNDYFANSLQVSQQTENGA